MKARASNRRATINQIDPSCDCGKACYPSMRDADASAIIARRRSNDQIHAYRCPDGGGWHIGHQKTRNHK